MPEHAPEVPAETFPETVITDWKMARLMFCLGYYLTSMVQRKDTGRGRARFTYHFRCFRNEYEACRASYFDSSLKLAARAFDEGEQQLLALQRDASETGEWHDPAAQ
jgi:hypothetical protein